MPQPRKALKRLEIGLPDAWYRDPAHYARELDAFWYRRWIAVCREEEIAGCGDWKLVKLGSQSIFVLKDPGGKFKAFHNTCRHRGSVLCTAESGTFARERIVCPYHSWTYDLAGRLIATPRRMQTPDFDMKKLPLYEVSSRTWGGFVFVCLSKNPPFNPPEEFKNYYRGRDAGRPAPPAQIPASAIYAPGSHLG